ncbi:MAG: STAS domain-containing protein [Candidatus Lindowbacteria bacterium]|nr:STAS domain-containing protein [Candidatus Lindowbacteria bacterium]
MVRKAFKYCQLIENETPVRIEVYGDLAGETVNQVSALTEALFSKQIYSHILDLSDTANISSSGVGLLVTSFHTSSRSGGKIVLLKVAPFVREALQVCGLLEHIKITNYYEEAVEALRQ